MVVLVFVGMFVMFIYLIVDMIFVGLWVGILGIVAIMVVMFIMFLIFSMGMVIGVGGSLIILWVLGGDDYDKVCKVFGNMVILILLLVVVLGLGLLFFFMLVLEFFGV